MNIYNNPDIIVIGAGAAGLLAAGSAAESGAKVLLIEKMERPGRKLLITGKGRCNITNTAPLAEFLKHTYPIPNFLRPAFNTFFSQDIISLLNKNGVKTITERGNRVFPVSNKSSDVVQALTSWLEASKVEIIRDSRVTGIVFENQAVKSVIAEKNKSSFEIRARSVIICTGGKSYPATGSSGDGYKFAEQAGHSINRAHPSLVPSGNRRRNSCKNAGTKSQERKCFLVDKR